MTPLCTLVAGFLLAAQTPFPDKPADPRPRDLPARGATPKTPAFRAAGVDATVGAMRLEQKHVARQVINMAANMRQGGVSPGEVYRTAVADFQRSAEIEKSLTTSDEERVEAILSHVVLLFELESYLQARSSGSTGGAADYLHVRFHRLGVQASLLVAVKADPAVIRRHRESQVAVGKSLDDMLAVRAQSGTLSEDMLVRAESVSSEATFAATRGAAPAERDAANRRAVECLKEAEKYVALRVTSRIASESTLHYVTYFRLDAELREVSAAEKPPADRVRQLREERRDAIRKVVELMAVRRAGGIFVEADIDQYRTAQVYLLEAELALAGDAEARRVLLKRNLKESIDHEECYAKRAAGGIANQSKSARCICDRIEAEIRLKLVK